MVHKVGPTLEGNGVSTSYLVSAPTLPPVFAPAVENRSACVIIRLVGPTNGSQSQANFGSRWYTNLEFHNDRPSKGWLNGGLTKNLHLRKDKTDIRAGHMYCPRRNLLESTKSINHRNSPHRKFYSNFKAKKYGKIDLKFIKIMRNPKKFSQR